MLRSYVHILYIIFILEALLMLFFIFDFKILVADSHNVLNLNDFDEFSILFLIF